MFRWMYLSLFFYALPSSANAQLDTTGVAAVVSVHLPHVRALVKKMIIPNRYMCVGPETHLVDSTDTITGWKGYSVKLYQYCINDKHDGSLRTNVYLLNADAERIARWTIAACWLVKKQYQEDAILSMIQQIDDESNGQFPIRGIVYEDIHPKDGVQETYIFFDGVSAAHKGFSIHTPKRADARQQARILSMTIDSVRDIFKWGRIISTTRPEYKALFPTADTVGLNWSVLVREEYKKALASDINWLIVAWAKANL